MIDVVSGKLKQKVLYWTSKVKSIFEWQIAGSKAPNPDIIKETLLATGEPQGGGNLSEKDETSFHSQKQFPKPGFQ